MTLDRRLHAHRPDLAAEKLAGKVQAPRYVTGHPARVAVPVADLRPRPDPEASIDSQILFGETVTVLDEQEGWSWVQCDLDDYVGYVPTIDLTAVAAPATHKVVVPRSFAYLGPDMKRPVVRALSMGSRLSVTSTAETRGMAYLVLDDGSSVVADHCIPVGQAADRDPVRIAERLIDTPYRWGGRSAFGIDCSGLVQMALMMCGIPALRDSDMQASGLGEPISGTDRRRGDLVFWKGHVAMMTDARMMIHASGKTMLVCHEPLEDAIARIRPLYGEPTIWRRPAYLPQ